MSNRLKLLPALITLLAGACTSIITYLVHYETKKALIILLIVLIIFYIMGTVVQRTIFKFELQIEKEERERAEEEGKVVEKDIPPGEESESKPGPDHGQEPQAAQQEQENEQTEPEGEES